jgi:chromate reductase
VRVLGICGSLRRDSYNRVLLQAAARELPAGIALEHYEELAEIPPYNEDVEEPAPPAVERLRRAIERADAILIATPEYNSSLPGVLKNALDWASRPFPDNCLRAKPVAVVGASTGLFGAVWAQAELRKVLRTIGAEPLDRELPISLAHQAFDRGGRLRHAALEAGLAEIVRALIGQPSQRAA